MAVGIDPVNLDAPQRIGLGALREVGKHIASIRPDILHTHLGSSDILGTAAARLLNIPAVSSIHAMEWSGSGVRMRGQRALMARSRRYCAARIIAVSESARNAYLTQGWDAPERVVTIHNGTDVSAQRGTGRAVRRELGIAPDDLVVGMVSGLRPEKGHDIAIAAVKLLHSRFPQLRLLIVGDGASRRTVARLAQPLGKTIVLAGARSDVMPVYDALDICLHPSRADAFPTTLLEAMAASVPVIASSVGGIPEIIEDGHSGTLVPAPPTAESVASALAVLIENSQRRRELGKAGQDRYQRCFTTTPWVERTRALYDTVLLEARSDLSTSTHWQVADRMARRTGAAVASVLFAAPRSAHAAAPIPRPTGTANLKEGQIADDESLESHGPLEHV